MITFYEFDVASAGTGTFAVTQVALRTTTGTQDITIPDFGTPKAVRIICNYAQTGVNPQSGIVGSIGASDGTDQFVSAWAGSNASTHNGGVYTRGATDAILQILSANNGAVSIEAAFDSFITDGVRINVGTNAPAQAVTVTVEFYGGADLTAKVGTTTLATQNNTTTITPGFESDAILFDSHTQLFDDSALATAIISTGVASWDGSTIRQAMHYYRSDSTTTSNIRGIVRDAAVWGVDARYAELTSISATQFVLTSRGGDLSARAVGYLALNFGGAHEAWVGVLNSPTATGNHDFTGPAFTPTFVSMRPTMMAATNGTESQDGTGGAWAVNSITDAAQYSNHWRDRDNVSVAAVLSKSETAANAVTMSDHAGTAAFTATYDSFLSNGVRLNFSVANGTVRKWPFLFIG